MSTDAPAADQTVIMAADPVLLAAECTENETEVLCTVARESLERVQLAIRNFQTNLKLQPDQTLEMINAITDTRLKALLLMALGKSDVVSKNSDEAPITTMVDLREVFSMIPRTSNSHAENARAFEKAVRRGVAGGIVTSLMFRAYRGKPNEPLHMLVLAAIQAVDTPDIAKQAFVEDGGGI